MRKHEDFVPECSAGPGTHSLLCADISALRERCKFGKELPEGVLQPVLLSDGGVAH